jgi:hypothetical protein
LIEKNENNIIVKNISEDKNDGNANGNIEVNHKNNCDYSDYNKNNINNDNHNINNNNKNNNNTNLKNQHESYPLKKNEKNCFSNDIDYKIIFESLSPSNIVTLFIAILVEYKVVIVSSISLNAALVLGEHGKNK